MEVETTADELSLGQSINICSPQKSKQNSTGFYGIGSKWNGIDKQIFVCHKNLGKILPLYVRLPTCLYKISQEAS